MPSLEIAKGVMEKRDDPESKDRNSGEQLTEKPRSGSSTGA